MKSLFFAFFLFTGIAAFAQDKTCNMWLGDLSDSAQNIKLFAEKYTEIQTKLQPSEDSKIQVMQDDNQLAQITIWMKPKKMLVSGAMATVYTISSFKVVSLSEKINALYAALAAKVKACTAASDAMSTLFGDSKMFIEKTSGGFGNKGLPMATLTVTAK